MPSIRVAPLVLPNRWPTPSSGLRERTGQILPPCSWASLSESEYTQIGLNIPGVKSKVLDVPVFPLQEKLPARIISIGIALSNAVNFAEDFLRRPLEKKLTAWFLI